MLHEQKRSAGYHRQLSKVRSTEKTAYCSVSICQAIQEDKYKVKVLRCTAYMYARLAQGKQTRERGLKKCNFQQFSGKQKTQAPYG